MSNANNRQVGGHHYGSPIQHWDYVWANDLDYFQGQITKYVSRWKNKNGVEDLKKAQHVLEKYIELVTEINEYEDDVLSHQMDLLDDGSDPTSAYVNQG